MKRPIRRRVVVWLLTALISAVIGYAETWIPGLIAYAPAARVALYWIAVLCCLSWYGVGEAVLTAGVTAVIEGLVYHSAIHAFDMLLAQVATIAVLWLLLRTEKVGLLGAGTLGGIVYAFVYTAMCSCWEQTGGMWEVFPAMALWYGGMFAVDGILAWFAVHYIPAALVEDKQDNTIPQASGR